MSKTLNERIHDGYRVATVFGNNDGVVLNTDDITAGVGKTLTYVIANKIINEDLKLEWVHSQKTVHCVEFRNTQLPIGDMLIMLCKDYTKVGGQSLMAGDTVCVLDIMQVSSKCILDISSVDNGKDLFTGEVNGMLDIETEPGKAGFLCMDFTCSDSSGIDIRVNGRHVYGISGMGMLLFKDNDIVFVGHQNIARLNALFEMGSSIEFWRPSLNRVEKQVHVLDRILGKHTRNTRGYSWDLRVDDNWEVLQNI